MTRLLRTNSPCLLLGIVAAAAFAPGCSGDNKTEPTAPPSVTSPQEVLSKLPGGDEFAAAKKVYADNNCARCHRLGDTGPQDYLAPGLTKVGVAPEHTKKWIAEHVRDATAYKPTSKMPKFPPEQISDADLNALAEYLASRK